jgi:hypothetical protein
MWESVVNTVISKRHATHIQIFIDGCNSTHFDWINEHNIAVTIQEPTQVTSCCNLLAPVHQLFSNSRSARMSFSQVQRVFIVEHYLASRSYITCQNELMDTFPDSPVPNKSTISRLVNRFRDTGSVQDRNRSNIRKRVNACIAERGEHFQHFLLDRFFFLFSVFCQTEHMSGMGCVNFRSSCIYKGKVR